MKKHSNITIFLVDDDPVFLKALEAQFREQTNYRIRTFSTGEECLKSLSHKPDIIFLDYNLDSSNPNAKDGLQILDKIKKINSNIEVVILSAQDQVKVALNCIKHEAFDYIIKNESAFMRAQKAIAIILNQDKLEKQIGMYKTFAIALFLSIAGSVIATIIMKFL